MRSGRARVAALSALAVLGLGYVLVFGLHAPSWNAAGEDCGTSAHEQTAAAKSWKVEIPADASSVYYCTEGSGGGAAGTAHFLFAVPRSGVTSYFTAMGIEPLQGYDVREDFAEFAGAAGRKTSDVTAYRAGSVTRGTFDYTVLVDEDGSGPVDVYVEVISSG